MLSILDYIREILESNQNDEDKLEAIFDLSIPLRKVMDKMSDATEIVGIHLAKILMFGVKPIWCKHITKNLNSLTINKLLDLPKKRYPTKEEFNEWLKKELKDEQDSLNIIKAATNEWEEEKTKYEKKIRNITSFEFLNIWNKFVDELSKIYIGDIRFQYNDIEKIIKNIQTN